MKKGTKRYKVTAYTRMNGEINRVANAINEKGLTLTEAKRLMAESSLRSPGTVYRIRRSRK